jgi:hypothetical protein
LADDRSEGYVYRVIQQPEIPMIDFLNWSNLSKPFEPDSKRTGALSAEHALPNESNQNRYSSIELMRSIARWENEGGAVPQITQPLPS